MNYLALREVDPPVLGVHPVVLGHLKRVYWILLRFESRKPFLLAEEPGEGTVEVLVCALE